MERGADDVDSVRVRSGVELPVGEFCERGCEVVRKSCSWPLIQFSPWENHSGQAPIDSSKGDTVSKNPNESKKEPVPSEGLVPRYKFACGKFTRDKLLVSRHSETGDK